jgi:hypothetical protein
MPEIHKMYSVCKNKKYSLFSLMYRKVSENVWERKVKKLNVLIIYYIVNEQFSQNAEVRVQLYW